jgi:serine protease AprX
MPDKVDKALAGQLKAGTATNKVLITVQPGFRGSIRKALELKGVTIKREHSALNLFVAEVDSATVLELAKNPLVTAVSLDGPIGNHQLGLPPLLSVGPSVTAASATVTPGTVVTVTVVGAPGRPNDWISLVPSGSADANYVAWQYLSGTTSLPLLGVTTATLQFVAPMTTGNYDVRLFTNGWTKLATTNPVAVQYPVPTLTVQTTLANPGMPITLNVTNAPGLRNDWIGLTPVGASDFSYVAWQYLSGTTTLPLTGTTSATLQFVAPATPGTYNVRQFANGWTKLATSVSIVVQGSPVVTSTIRETLGLPAVATSTTLTGSGGIGVAIIDSGISPSADFAGRITGFYDFTYGLNGVPVAPYDDYGHGTHVAGLIGSSGALSNYAVQGVAPSVNLVGLKVLDGTGAGLTSDVINALQFVTVNKAALNVQIVNMSLGHPIWAAAANDPLVQAVQQATAAGLIVVVSAGNVGRSPEGVSGYAGVTSPCNAPSSICVGTANTQNTVTRDDDVVAPYSSRGPSWYDGFAKPDVIAPGHKVASDTTLTSYLYGLLPTSRVQAANGAPLLSLNGTSMSAGVASGVVALVLDAHNHNGLLQQPALTANEVKAILQYSAIALPNVDALSQGAGEINAAGAMALASSIDTSLPAGSWWLTQGVTPSTAIGGQAATWAQNIVWGDSVYGGDVVYRNNIIWGNNVIWGSTNIAGANIIWGSTVTLNASNMVWGNNIIWGSNIVWGDRLIGERVAGTNIVWGDNVIWGSNIVWGELSLQNAVWGTRVNSTQVLWGTVFGSNIVWGETSNIVWAGTTSIIYGQNVIWGSNIVWGENIVNGESAAPESGLIEPVVVAPLPAGNDRFVPAVTPPPPPAPPPPGPIAFNSISIVGSSIVGGNI